MSSPVRRDLDFDQKQPACDWRAAAGIPKRDDRGRTLDVHALRTTFGTLLSSTGALPRVAQAAMQHSDIKLTMGVYTDPRMLGIREAVERLPSLALDATSRAAGPRTCPTKVTGTGYNSGQSGASTDTVARTSSGHGRQPAVAENATNSNERPPVTSAVIGGHDVGVAGFEPTTSCSQGRRPATPQVVESPRLRPAYRPGRGRASPRKS